MNSNRDKVNAIVLIALLWLPACASSAPKVPYPVFVQVDKLDDVFLAGLPGVRARQFRGDARSIRFSTLLRIPADWEFSTGAAPDKSVEIFVLAGELDVGGLTLHPGGYAYLPPGSMGSSMRTKGGAEILYFLDDVDAHAVIQMPLITGVDSGRWEPMSDDPEDFGLTVMQLRSDPGSGARTWLLRIDPVASQSWQTFSADLEGFLVSGKYRHSECVDGKPATAVYSSGGYFFRPAGAINAGPKAKSLETSIWFLRTQSAGHRKLVGACESTE